MSSSNLYREAPRRDLRHPATTVRDREYYAPTLVRNPSRNSSPVWQFYADTQHHILQILRSILYSVLAFPSTLESSLAHMRLEVDAQIDDIPWLALSFSVSSAALHM
jgi:hypothetical protein